MKVLISSAVHHAPHILADQAKNFAAYLPGAIMLVHVSESSTVPFQDFETAVRGLDHVILNPNRMPTVWGDIIGPHILNLEFAQQLGEFDRFAISSSQELFFRSGLIDRLSSFEAGYDHEKLFDQDYPVPFLRMLRADERMQALFLHLGVKEIIWSQVDGSFYPWEFSKELLNLCDRFLDISSKTSGYFREEVVFQTLFHRLHPNATKCYPYVLRLAAFNYWIQHRVRARVSNEFVIKVIRRLVRLRYPRYYTLGLYHKIKGGRFDDWSKYETLQGRRHLDLDGIFSLKRVQSELSDPVRLAIRANAPQPYDC